MLDLYLIRHAESLQNLNPAIIGGRSLTTPLSNRGKIQANLLGLRLKKEQINFSEIYSSTALRAIQTSEIVSEHIGFEKTKIVKLEELLEIDQGDWEGKPRYKYYTPENIALMNANHLDFKAPNGESQRMVEERMYAFVKTKLLQRYNKNICTAIFTHGLSIKCLLRGILDFNSEHTYKIVINNSSITCLKYTKKGWHLVTVNDTAHLIGYKKNRR